MQQDMITLQINYGAIGEFVGVEIANPNAVII